MSQPILAWGDTEGVKVEKDKTSSAADTPGSSEKKGTIAEKKAKDAIKPKADDSKKDMRALEEGKPLKKERGQSSAKVAEKGATADAELDGEAGVDAEELAAHHMPDLIEGHQPMFGPPSSSVSSASAATASPAANASSSSAVTSAAKQKHNGTLNSEVAAQPAAQAPATPIVPAPPASTVAGVDESAATAAPTASAKEDASSGW